VKRRAVASFAPVVGREVEPRVLVLGSMPGEASLAAQQYYAHPQNAFWRLVGAVYGFAPELEYAERLRLLTANGVALWDVLARCHRRGSLDSAIERASAATNDFAGLFAAHPTIAVVCLNGALAHDLFERRVVPLVPAASRLVRHRLPSTSPAHAGLGFAAKLAAWRAALRATQ
jgi:double-stranded uracil-DNA glycosylase